MAFLVGGCSSSNEIAENDANSQLEVEPSSNIGFECAGDRGVEGEEVLELLFDVRERNRDVFLQFPTVDVLCDVADVVCNDSLGIFASELDELRLTADAPDADWEFSSAIISEVFCPVSQ